MGPKAVVIKRGEYGFVMYAENKFFILPAYPVSNVVDPTGAGDTFAGGFFGYLARADQPIGFEQLKQACVNGCLLASFTVEDFGLGAIRNLTWGKVEERLKLYNQVIAYPG